MSGAHSPASRTEVDLTILMRCSLWWQILLDGTKGSFSKNLRRHVFLDLAVVELVRMACEPENLRKSSVTATSIEVKLALLSSSGGSGLNSRKETLLDTVPSQPMTPCRLLQFPIRCGNYQLNDEEQEDGEAS